MTTCVGLFNGKDYVLATDGRISARNIVATNSQNKLIQLTPDIHIAFSGTQFLFTKIKTFMQSLDDATQILKNSSFSALPSESQRDNLEMVLERFLGIESETNPSSEFNATVEEAELCIRIIWEGLVEWLEDSGSYILESFEGSKESFQLSAVLLVATPVGIFDVTPDGYASHGHIRVLGNRMALGSVASDLVKGTEPITVESIDLYLESVPLSQMETMASKAISITSAHDSSTSSNSFYITYKGTGEQDES